MTSHDLAEIGSGSRKVGRVHSIDRCGINLDATEAKGEEARKKGVTGGGRRQDLVDIRAAKVGGELRHDERSRSRRGLHC